MATELVHNRSMNATNSLATRQYCFVKLDTAGGITLCTAGAFAVGVLQDKPGAGDPGAVCSPGDLTKVKAGGHITSGQFIMSDGSGLAVAATSGSFVLGQAREAGESGDIIQIHFSPVGESGFALGKL